MDVAHLGTRLHPGQPKESQRLFEGEGYVVAAVTLRSGASIPPHVAKEPIVVTCVAGAGEFVTEETGEVVGLTPGTVLALPAGVRHALRTSSELRVVIVRVVR